MIKNGVEPGGVARIYAFCSASAVSGIAGAKSWEKASLLWRNGVPAGDGISGKDHLLAG